MRKKNTLTKISYAEGNNDQSEFRLRFGRRGRGNAELSFHVQNREYFPIVLLLDWVHTITKKNLGMK